MIMRVKICGITRSDQAQSIAQLGATALGFICVETSPRYLTPPQVAAIVADLCRHSSGAATIDRVGVFANASVETIVQVVTQANLNAVQLHGDESAAFCQAVRSALPQVEMIKALRVRDAEMLQRTADYAEAIDTLLLDAYQPNVLGGTGKTLDWTMLQRFQSPCPWLLAGGLTPDNIVMALDRLQPAGIDLSSGVEHRPGDKDLTKVAQLFRQLEQCRS